MATKEEATGGIAGSTGGAKRRVAPEEKTTEERTIAQRVAAITNDPDYAAQLTMWMTEMHLSDEAARMLLKTLYIDDSDIPFLKAVSEIVKYEGFNPRRLADIMKQTHTRWKTVIEQDPDALKVVRMNFSVNGLLRSFEISNNMGFSEDIKWLCKIFVTRGVASDKNRKEFMQTCLNILKVKYNINMARRKPGVTLDNKIITLRRIAAAFPSVTVDLFHKGYGSSIVDPTVLFPGVDLPRAIFSPMMPSMLVRVGDVPHALLIAIAVSVDDILHQTKKTSLQNLYNYYLAAYNSDVATDEIKRHHCLHWNVMKITATGEEYVDSIRNVKDIAKNIISASRRTDPFLTILLTKI